MLGFITVLLTSLFAQSLQADALDEIGERGVLRWGADAEGGAPYVFPDPGNPGRLIGFEVEIAEELAARLGVRQEMVQTLWSTLPQALLRGDFDIILNGLEVTPERRRHIDFTDPYYEFHEALMVRQENQDIHSLPDLRGRRVGTLKGTLAQQMLEPIPQVQVILYEGQVEPYRDLSLGRLEAVLMDFPIARYYGEKISGLKYVGTKFGAGFYAIGIRQEDDRLRKALDEALAGMRRDGTLQQMLSRWGLIGEEEVQFEPAVQPLTLYLPLLAKAAGLTIFLSIVSMALAVLLGLSLCLMRVYGPRPVQKLAIGYIELFRGTPLLLQLLVIYFGLPSVGLAFPAWVAAILGLSLNYAAYEAEIFRAGISSVHKGQMEAALSLGMSRSVAVREIILPQAFRISLPATTNDFITLFKDSSLCSVIGVTELTKQFNILAVSTWRVMELGVLTALLYLLMSYPLSLLARRWEAHLSRGV